MSKQVLEFYGNSRTFSGQYLPITVELNENFELSNPPTHYSEGLGSHKDCGGAVKILTILLDQKDKKIIFRFFCIRCAMARDVLGDNQTKMSDLISILHTEDKLLDLGSSRYLKRAK